jgi:HEPN domain-containing protein
MPITRKDLQDLSRVGLKEADSLYKAKHYDGCVYLAGYAVELALKARICKLLRVNEYPLSGEIGRAFKIHSLEQLKVLAGLSSEIDVKRNKQLFDNWSKVDEVGSRTALRFARHTRCERR